MAFSHDGKHLVAGLYDLTVHIFDLAIGKSITVVKAGYKSGCYELSKSPRASIFAATVKDE